MNKLSEQLIQITDELASRCSALQFAPPVSYVYNPLQYARAPHCHYLQTYAKKGVALWVGMNPGPFGMAQTGVPFGDVAMARDFLQITGVVENLPAQHPKRPIDGFACTRSEVSGTRLWGLAKSEFKTPAAFFKRFFVVNYCPLVFMGESGKNITPDKLPVAEQHALFDVCDDALKKLALALKATHVVGVGAFARGACERALAGEEIPIGQLLHPSPASPAANRGWAQAAMGQLQEMKLI